MPERPLVPPELARALIAARRVEAAATRTDQRERAIHATANLMLAAVDAGWQVTEVAAAAGLKRHAASKRVVAARQRARHPVGLDLPPVPPHKPLRPLRVLRTPVGDRDWLRSSEAATFARVSVQTIHNWQRAGLLPHTEGVNRRVVLYLRADLLRVMTGPRYNIRGAHYAAIRAAIGGATTAGRRRADAGVEVL